ncbi:hypothetical protein [Rufibacter quisquiliarum]|uniref:Uncharacterized protein n=1 Tax=Rufibacter quisquiliarum TaxID=1549639 RepID=A0A839GTI1_9BACT|nr:hypothetical protein [Rufibacter quisquiliarum]MBA9078116.1 hypothetical protein [Rufibacter quisquiliarum]
MTHQTRPFALHLPRILCLLRASLPLLRTPAPSPVCKGWADQSLAGVSSAYAVHVIAYSFLTHISF